jgi:hypothetical protein
MRLFIILALIAVPLMLFVKPIYENSKHNHKSHPVNEESERQYYAINDPDEHKGRVAKHIDPLQQHDTESESKKHSFADLFIH